MKIPKQWTLTTLYMIFIFCVFIAMAQYAKHHPLTDAPPPANVKNQGRSLAVP